MKMHVHLSVAAALALTGCASTPRAFSPVLAGGEASPAYEAAFARCAQEVAAGRRSSFRTGRSGSALGGLAVGAAAGVAAAGSAASGMGMLGGVAAGAGLTAGALVVAPLAIYGISRAQRARKEAEIKTAMAACLAEEGHVVSDWTPAAPDAPLRSPTIAAPPDA